MDRPDLCFADRVNLYGSSIHARPAVLSCICETLKHRFVHWLFSAAYSWTDSELENRYLLLGLCKTAIIVILAALNPIKVVILTPIKRDWIVDSQPVIPRYQGTTVQSLEIIATTFPLFL